MGGVCQRQSEESDTSILVIHEGDAVIHGFTAEFSLHYIDLRRSDSPCKSNTSLIKYLAGLNILNVANTAATNGVAVMQTCPIGEPLSNNSRDQSQFPLMLICCFAAPVGKFRTRWDYDDEWGTQIHVWWPMKNRGASDFGVLSSESLFSLTLKKKKKKPSFRKTSLLLWTSFPYKPIVEGKRLCVSH